MEKEVAELPLGAAGPVFVIVFFPPAADELEVPVFWDADPLPPDAQLVKTALQSWQPVGVPMQRPPKALGKHVPWKISFLIFLWEELFASRIFKRISITFLYSKSL